jgi:predicted nuclease with TOPRIM domain
MSVAACSNVSSGTQISMPTALRSILSCSSGILMTFSLSHLEAFMGYLDGIEELIAENTSATTLRERLALAKEEFALLEKKVLLLETENATLNAENQRIELENSHLRIQLQDLEQRVTQSNNPN